MKNKIVCVLLLASALFAGGCISAKSQADAAAFVQGLLATLPHSFTGSKHFDHSDAFNIGVSVDFKGLKWDDAAKQWTWTAASYSGHSPWTATNESDSPDTK